MDALMKYAVAAMPAKVHCWSEGSTLVIDCCMTVQMSVTLPSKARIRPLSQRWMKVSFMMPFLQREQAGVANLLRLVDESHYGTTKVRRVPALRLHVQEVDDE